jgi:hypothetical protein
LTINGTAAVLSTAACAAVLLDWKTEHRSEPFFSTAMRQDWPADLAAIGFEIRRVEIVDDSFPWVLVATKPA